jgi:molybdopterin-dependent oxidoreductase alpha subunit
MGGNFLSATPDTHYTAEALKRCRLTVHVSTKLNRSHLVHGQKALILPCLGRTEIDKQASGEQFVTCENSMGIVHMSKGILAPCSPNIKSETAIVCELANSVLKEKTTVKWLELKENYDKIRDLIEKVVPDFDNFNQKVRQPSGFYLPNKPRDEQSFATHSGKAEFTVNTVTYQTLQQGEYIMMTIRSHDQFNTTIYGLNDRYRGIHNERRIVLMHQKDMDTEGVKPNDIVDLTSHYDNTLREARQFIVVPYDIPQGNIATYFPEANTLIPITEYADKSHTPISKSVVVRVRKKIGV